MSTLIKELPEDQKPRERAIKDGLTNLNDEELIAILLRAGTQQQSAKDVALTILKRINGLSHLTEITLNDLKKVKGVGTTKALSLLAALELGNRVLNKQVLAKKKIMNASDIYDLLKYEIVAATQENFFVVFLDSKHQVISYRRLFIGTINASIVHAREIFKSSIEENAVSIIVAHNHPSGDVTPSFADKQMTRKLKESGELLDIPLIDHIILGNNNYYSFKANEWGDTDDKKNL